jgi:hypothetical protein
MSDYQMPTELYYSLDLFRVNAVFVVPRCSVLHGIEVPLPKPPRVVNKLSAPATQ